jgi:hypothetical protein
MIKDFFKKKKRIKKFNDSRKRPGLSERFSGDWEKSLSEECGFEAGNVRN